MFLSGCKQVLLLGCYNKSWEIFLVAHTYINDFITSEALSWMLTDCSQAPYVQLTQTEPSPQATPPFTKKWGSRTISGEGSLISTTLPQTCSGISLSRYLSTIFKHVRIHYEHNWTLVTCVITSDMSVTHVLLVSHQCNDHHTPDTSVTSPAACGYSK